MRPVRIIPRCAIRRLRLPSGIYNPFKNRNALSKAKMSQNADRLVKQEQIKNLSTLTPNVTFWIFGDEWILTRISLYV